MQNLVRLAKHFNSVPRGKKNEVKMAERNAVQDMDIKVKERIVLREIHLRTTGRHL